MYTYPSVTSWYSFNSAIFKFKLFLSNKNENASPTAQTSQKPAKPAENSVSEPIGDDDDLPF